MTTNVLLRLAPTIKMREHEIEVQVRLKTLGNVADKLREYLEVETAPDDLLERAKRLRTSATRKGRWTMSHSLLHLGH